jgi:hypothetical protein
VNIGFWWGDLRERYHFEDLDVDGRIIMKWIFKKWVLEVWTGLTWLRIETDGGLL